MVSFQATNLETVSNGTHVDPSVEYMSVHVMEDKMGILYGESPFFSTCRTCLFSIITERMGEISPFCVFLPLVSAFCTPCYTEVECLFKRFFSKNDMSK